MDYPYPELNLKQLRRMTDDTGIFQHGKYDLPDRATGYTTDDNARGLIAAVRLYEACGKERLLRLAETYLGFLHYAQLAEGRFHNFMSYDRRWADRVGSEDSFGRALWGLGTACAGLGGCGGGALARELFERALPQVPGLGSPRAWAFSLLGLVRYLEVFTKDDVARETAVQTADKLVDLFGCTATSSWSWFEDRLTYSNAIMPAALFAAYRLLQKKELLQAARESLAFLTQIQWTGRYFKLIGCQGWYVKGGKKAEWDEQPEDASCLVLAYSEAFYATSKTAYIRYAGAAMDWFYGRNAQGLALVDPQTGGCYDGLTAGGVNENQGAESLLAHLIGRLEMAALRASTKKKKVAREAN